MSNIISRIPHDYAIIWHKTSQEIPLLNENDEAFVLMYCNNWTSPVSGMCRIGWDGHYYVEWLRYNNDQWEIITQDNSIEYFNPDYWTYVTIPK